MNLKGHSIESAAEYSSCPVEVIAMAVEGKLPQKVVDTIESLLFRVGREALIRARGDMTIEQAAEKCNLSPSLYKLIEDGMVAPPSARDTARAMGITAEEACAPVRNKLYAIRRARNLTQATVAAASGISQPELSRAESGQCSRRLVESILKFYESGEFSFQKPIDTYAYLRHKHNLTVADIMSLTGLSKDQVTYGCPELDSFFERIS